MICLSKPRSFLYRLISKLTPSLRCWMWYFKRWKMDQSQWYRQIIEGTKNLSHLLTSSVRYRWWKVSKTLNSNRNLIEERNFSWPTSMTYSEPQKTVQNCHLLNQGTVPRFSNDLSTWKERHKSLSEKKITFPPKNWEFTTKTWLSCRSCWINKVAIFLNFNQSLKCNRKRI